MTVTSAARTAIHAILFLIALLPEGAVAAEMPDFRKIDAFIESETRANHIPGVAVALTHDARIVYMRGFGLAGPGRRMTPDTPLYIGSVSKSVTALAIMQLVEAGKIALDCPARNYLPWFEVADARASEKITVRDLLNQVSGLADSGFTGHVPQNATLEECVHSLRRACPVEPVGTTFQYFNSNYRILGLIVEKVSGRPFGEYLAENIFRPLQMIHTRASPYGTDLAQGYIPLLGFPVAFPQRYLPYAVPSGYIISTAEDMAHFLIAQGNEGRYGQTRVLSPKGIELMQTPRIDLKSLYGMGWFVEHRDGVPLIRHSGDLDTFHGDAILLREQKYGLILLYNESGVLPEALVFPHMWEGMVRLLNGQNPNSQISLRTVSLILVFVIVVSFLIEVRGLVSLRQWQEQIRNLPGWRRISIAAWSFAFPAVPLIGLPALYAALTGRDVEILFLRAPDIIGWFVVWSTLGIIKGAARTWMVVRLARRETGLPPNLPTS